MTDTFGQLRSALHAGDRRLLVLLDDLYRELGEDAYEDQVIPYLEGFEHLRDIIVYPQVQNLGHLKGALKLCPMGNFVIDHEFPQEWKRTTVRKLLTRGEILEHVRDLRLNRLDVNDQDAKALAQNPHFCNLERLELWRHEMTEDGVEAILESPHLQNLSCLYIGSQTMSDYSKRLCEDAARENPSLEIRF